MAKRKRKPAGGGAFGGKRSPRSPQHSLPSPAASQNIPPIADPAFLREKDRFMELVGKELQAQNFESKEEANAFLNEHFLNRPMGEILAEHEGEPDPHFEALDILARIDPGTPNAIVRKRADEALAVDPLCSEAWIHRARIETSRKACQRHLERAVEVGREKVAEEIAEVEQGRCPSLWMVPRARSFMQALHELAEHFQSIAELGKSRALYEEILRLNPNDNQGVRYELLSVLVIMNDLEAAEALLDDYPDDPSCAWLYGRALVEFSLALGDDPDFAPRPKTARPFDHLKSPRLATARTALAKAVAEHPWGAAFLLDPIATLIQPLSTYRAFSPEEALECARVASDAWTVPLFPALWLASEFFDFADRRAAVRRIKKEHADFLELLALLDELGLSFPEEDDEDAAAEAAFLKAASDKVTARLLALGGGAGRGKKRRRR
ncbi:MAG: hypothetical protein WD342_15535 [Verrucomicrobiales bacterium]